MEENKRSEVGEALENSLAKASSVAASPYSMESDVAHETRTRDQEVSLAKRSIARSWRCRWQRKQDGERVAAGDRHVREGESKKRGESAL